jgi:hypothetical protein
VSRARTCSFHLRIEHFLFAACLPSSSRMRRSHDVAVSPSTASLRVLDVKEPAAELHIEPGMARGQSRALERIAEVEPSSLYHPFVVEARRLPLRVQVAYTATRTAQSVCVRSSIVPCEPGSPLPLVLPFPCADLRSFLFPADRSRRCDRTDAIARCQHSLERVVRGDA